MKSMNPSPFGILFICLMALSVFSCQKEASQKEAKKPNRFQKIEPVYSGVNFENSFIETTEFNFITYPYIYGGAGLAVGDLNNDELPDIYMVSNYGADRIYLNKGDFKFQDITESCGVRTDLGWKTGVSMVDINADGYLDIYVNRSGPVPVPEIRKNLLYINQKNGTFKEEAAKWGLDHEGFSTQAYFFDYDQDGDLDMYQLNHRVDFKNTNVLNKSIKEDIQFESSDHLFENIGDRYVNVTERAGIQNKAWGLSCSIGDFNNDNRPDIYVCNDYLDPDILYINQGNGQFKDEIQTRFSHTSFYSMGSDYSDINNDGYNDLMVLDMLAEDHKRNKENMASMSTSNFWKMIQMGYHYQYMSNMLQLNLGNGYYSDIGQMAGISKTDWSWAPLAVDFNNDGNKDIFVTNGIYKDVTNRDANIFLQQLSENKQSLPIDSLIALLPAQKQRNCMFINQGNLKFKNKATESGLGQSTFSSGAAYADLDNDGDLDLVMNNTSDKAGIYKNQSEGNNLKIQFEGSDNNSFGIGATVEIYHSDQYQMMANYPTKGYLSSVDNRLHFGLGQDQTIDKLIINWPNGDQEIMNDVKANQILKIKQGAQAQGNENKTNSSEIFTAVNPLDHGLNYRHQEVFYDDYGDQLLLPQKKSVSGPCSVVADVNGDGKDDIFIGGASGQSAALYLQGNEDQFKISQSSLFEQDKEYEDQCALFLDIDQDADLDLIVGSGSYEFKDASAQQLDRIYLNDGTGTFSAAVPLSDSKTNTKVIRPIDFDQDGDMDLLIGAYVQSSKYPFSPSSFLLENQEGTFIDVTKDIAPEWNKAGMIYDISVMDYDADGDMDFIAAGEWMPLSLFNNKEGSFVRTAIPGFEKTSGWWYSLHTVDIDKDGDLDLLAGNLGTNNKFNPKKGKDFHVYCNDFDDSGNYDIVLSKENNGVFLPVRGRECSSQQVPEIATNFESYKAFSDADIMGIYGEEKIKNAEHLMVQSFATTLFINQGNSDFKAVALPAQAQTGPTLDVHIQDLNEDGHLDIIGVGAIFEAEVETIRYDANKGYVLYGDGTGGYKAAEGHGFFQNTNARTIETLTIGNKQFFLIANNDNFLSMQKMIR